MLNPVMQTRRSFVRTVAGTGAMAAVGDLGFLAQLPRVSAAEAALPPRMVQLHPEIAPIVRLLEETPRPRVLEEVAARIKRGLTYREVLAALLLAGVRSIQPRPVGFKFHAVLVVNSAHLASLSSPDADRWLPIFWAIDQFKNSQAANLREGGWTLAPVDEAAVPPSHNAKRAFIDAMDNWDEAAADATIAGLARTASAHEIFEILCRYGARDFREIGHKEIYVANSFRTLEAIGWQHAEPVLRSLAYALLDRTGDRGNPAKADFPADRPFRTNLGRVKRLRTDWLDGQPSAAATVELLRTLREGSPDEASEKVVELVNRGVAVQSIFDALFDGAGELLMRAPGILSLHATTFTNALHYAWTRCEAEETRKLLVLQNAAFLTLFRASRQDKGIKVDQLEAASPPQANPIAVGEIFQEVSRDRLSASRLVLAYLQDKPEAKEFINTARQLIFLKGNDAHDYKFSSAVLEDFHAMTSPWRDRYLAASVFNLKGANDPDNGLVTRIRAALNA